jgi:ribonuclease HI
MSHRLNDLPEGRRAPVTNNRAELTAALYALQAAKRDAATPPGTPVVISSDSQYVINGMTSWMPGWVRSNWQTRAGTDVLNRDLWEDLANEVVGSGREIHWRYVKAHNGDPGNEAADRLAVNACRR